MAIRRRRNRLFTDDFPRMPFAREAGRGAATGGFGAPPTGAAGFLREKQDVRVSRRLGEGIREINYGKRFGIRRRVW